MGNKVGKKMRQFGFNDTSCPDDGDKVCDTPTFSTY
jgi:hypothetical protein